MPTFNELCAVLWGKMFLDLLVETGYNGSTAGFLNWLVTACLGDSTSFQMLSGVTGVESVWDVKGADNLNFITGHIMMDAHSTGARVPKCVASVSSHLHNFYEYIRTAYDAYKSHWKHYGYEWVPFQTFLAAYDTYGDSVGQMMRDRDDRVSHLTTERDQLEKDAMQLFQFLHQIYDDAMDLGDRIDVEYKLVPFIDYKSLIPQMSTDNLETWLYWSNWMPSTKTFCQKMRFLVDIIDEGTHSTYTSELGDARVMLLDIGANTKKVLTKEFAIKFMKQIMALVDYLTRKSENIPRYHGVGYECDSCISGTGCAVESDYGSGSDPRFDATAYILDDPLRALEKIIADADWLFFDNEFQDMRLYILNFLLEDNQDNEWREALLLLLIESFKDPSITDELWDEWGSDSKYDLELTRCYVCDKSQYTCNCYDYPSGCEVCGNWRAEGSHDCDRCRRKKYRASKRLDRENAKRKRKVW
jgi:hypothetical protein